MDADLLQGLAVFLREWSRAIYRLTETHTCGTTVQLQEKEDPIWR